MFVNPISNFNVTSNSYQNNSQGVKRMSAGTSNLSQLSADTVSFGEKMNKKQKASRLAQLGAAAALVAGGPLYTACTPDLELNQSQHQGMWVNVENYHKCGCDSFPIIIPGGRDTVYIERPGELVHDTIYIEKPGETVRDTIYIDRPGPTVTDTIYIDNPPDTIYIDRPGPTITDTVYVDRPVYDTIYVDRPVVDTIYVDRPVHDTIWIKPDTVYIPKNPHFEINDSINKDIDDFDIPTEGEGDFVYAFQGRNEYLGANHFLLFNGFFSSEHQSSFIDHAFEEDDIPAGGDKPSKYYYTRYDISSDYENGRRLVKVYHPRENRHQLPDDKKRGEAGWKQVGEFYVKNASVAGTAQLIANDMDGTLKAKFSKNEKRGPGNIYKEWPLNDNQMPKTTIQNVKAYRKDLGKLED